MFPHVLFSHWRIWRLKGDLSSRGCTGLGEGQCSRHVAASTLLMQPGLVSEVQGVLCPHTHVLGPSQGCLTLEQLSVVLLVRGGKSDQPMSPSW